MMERAVSSLEMKRLKAENNLQRQWNRLILIPRVKNIEESGRLKMANNLY